MDEERREAGEPGPEGSAAHSEYPRAPGASKMEALRRIERSLEEQSEHTPDRERTVDARDGERANDEPDADVTDEAGGDSPA